MKRIIITLVVIFMSSCATKADKVVFKDGIEKLSSYSDIVVRDKSGRRIKLELAMVISQPDKIKGEVLSPNGISIFDFAYLNGKRKNWTNLQHYCLGFEPKKLIRILFGSVEDESGVTVSDFKRVGKFDIPMKIQFEKFDSCEIEIKHRDVRIID